MWRALVMLSLALSFHALASGCRDGNTPAGPSSGPGGGDGGSGAAGGAGGGGGTGGSGGFVEGPFILQGTVVTPSQVFDGQVLVVGDTIECVAEGTTCAETSDAAVIDTGGIIAPGLIDTHNHILFDIFDETDWSPTLPSCGVAADCDSSPYCNGDCGCVGGQCFYLDHTQWPDEDEYALMLDYKQCLEDASQGKPVWCPRHYDGDGDVRCEMDKWGEMKGLIAGTTSIVGLPGTSGACFGSLARSIDVAQNDLDDDRIQTSALFPPSTSSGDGVCQNFSDGDTAAYLIHVGEGVNQDARDEFAELGALTTTDGCLYAPQTTITHGTAFGAAEFSAMAAAGMKLTWSPASNVSLYGTTTDIPAALAAGVTVALAPDWSMGGSQNLLDELSFARTWSDTHWGGALDDRLLVEMVTVNAAAVLGLADRLGRLEAGYLADVVVIAGDTSDPYGAIVSATPADVRLVLVGGAASYGDADFMPLVSPDVVPCSALDVCGASKFLCAAEASSDDKLDQTYEQVREVLEAALDDLDAIPTLAPGACTPACAADEACFARTVHPEVAPGNCGGCPSGEACFQTAMSGNNQYNCLTINACAPAKTRNMAPLTPIVRCD